MQRLTLFLLLLMLLSSVELSAQGKRVQSLLDAERARFEAMTRRDTTALRQMLAEELTYVHSNGLRESKAEHLSNIAKGRIVYQEMVPIETQVRRYGKVGLITGVVRVGGLYEDRRFELRLRYTSAYVRKGGKWRLVAWQSGSLP